jgi:ubiquinone/menaquinone biosynthesis C-methylase UbiE
MALAGRAMNVAPLLADRYPLPKARRLLDVGGGTGLYSIAWLQRHPSLHAVVWDRPEVLKVAQEMAQRFGVADRLECVPGDMFTSPVPTGADVVLLSNILHDWDVPECRALISRCAGALPPDGQLLIHDVFLNDGLDGPLPIALYSAALFILTEGRAYSAAEYRGWLVEAGLVPGPITPTLVHCGVLPASRG